MKPPSRSPLKAATTFSLRDSGLLEPLGAAFAEWGGPEIVAVAVGTGEALSLGRQGQVDVVITHNPGWELQFVEGGHGVNRREFMTNDFLLAGPARDRARVTGADSVYDALERIFRAEATFLSRGDDSGTNLREIELWASTGLLPFGRPWYRAVTGGMVRCLEAASEQGAYTLADSATFQAQGGRLALRVVCADLRNLRNAYSVIVVNPARHPKVNYEGGMMLVTFLTSSAGQTRIRDFRVGGQRLFQPVWDPMSDNPDATREGQAASADPAKGDRFGLVR